MKVKERFGRKLFVVVNAVVLSLIGFCCLAPMLHVVCCSLSDPLILARDKSFLLWPLGTWNFSGYAAILTYGNILTGYVNTIFYVVVGTIMNLVMTSVAAYVLSRKRFVLADPIMLLVSFTMLFNGGMIPNFLLVQKLGLLDSYWSVLLPGALSVFNLIIMRTSFREIPDALEESARLDGANELQILIRIILPVSKATLAVISLFVAVMFWNSWFTASLYLSDRSKWPLQLFLREILISNSQRTLDSDVRSAVLAQQSLIKYCTIIVATLPILCLYPSLQKYFVKGVMIGAIKG
jgi:putative aldouronate transport system permease protein